MKVQKSAMLTSRPLRDFAIFSVGFFFVTTLLTAFVIIPKINGSIESQYLKDSQEELKQEAELFKRFVQGQKTILQDLAKFPSVAGAVMMSDGSGLAISDLFENVVISGEKGLLVLQDIEGASLIKTSNNLKGIYTFEQSWLKQVLDGSLPYHFQLLGQEKDRFTFQMSIPVVYGNYIEGVLSAEITVPLSQVFVTQTFNKNIAFRLTQNQTAIFTPFDHIKLARENAIELDSPDLTFTYITDDGPIHEKAASLRNSIFLVLLIGLSISFLLFALLGYRSLMSKDKVLKLQRSLWLVYALPIFVATIGAGASVAAYLTITNLQQSALETKLLMGSKTKIQSFRNKINLNLDVLDSVKALFDASSEVTRTDFKTFTYQLLANNKSIQALQWVPYVAHNQREIMENQARADGLKDFTIRKINGSGELTPSENQGSYFPVYFVEPKAGNESALGFDLSSSDRRFTALLKARNTGKKIATSRVSLIQDESQTGLMLLYAVYDYAVALDSLARRQSQLKGFVVMVLKTDYLVREVIGFELDGHSMFIQDITEAHDPDILFGIEPVSEAFVRSETIDIAGRFWRVTTSDTLFKEPFWWISLLVLFSGLTFTVFIVVGLVNLIRRRELIELLVEQQTTELRMLSSTVANANDVFIITQADELNKNNGGPKITYVNEAFTRLTGYSNKEALGNTPRMLQGKNTDRAVLDKMRIALENGESFFCEVINYTKGGDEYWLEINISPLKDEKGNVTHFAAVERDITNRKHNQHEREQLIQSLSKSNELNDAIISGSEHMIIATDLNGLVTLFNQAAENELGYKAAEVVGVHEPILWHDGNEVVNKATVLSKELSKLIEPGFDVFVIKPRTFGRETAKWTFIKKNGSSFVANLTVTCIRNKRFEITGYLGVVEDMTDQKS